MLLKGRKKGRGYSFRNSSYKTGHYAISYKKETKKA